MSLYYDPERVSSLISSLRGALRLLRDLATLPKQDFMQDMHRQSSAKYNLITAIEAIVDISNHLISRNGWRAPESYADTFDVLVENGALSQDHLDDFKAMARFRNRLVHLYWDVDLP
ncbi:MAG: DUF86 domain-containing protein [Chitinivibrionales bacterium]|nr:DUF86 domain-containing protein [Chitinivibrionales bacterium]MBD3356823.1 DUF86 domain-containing protein [Chitinivibrionales bacterium]